VIGNIARRGLYYIRQECAAALKRRAGGSTDALQVEGDHSETLASLLDDRVRTRTHARSLSVPALTRARRAARREGLLGGPRVVAGNSPVRDRPARRARRRYARRALAPSSSSSAARALTRVGAEIVNVNSNIAEHAVEHIHAKEVILTFGESRTVLAFFVEAAKLRKFEVIVAEGAPSFSGHRMAVELAKHNIETTLITDSAVFALMSNVNKVIVGTHAVVANGGLIAHTGAHNLAAAAKAHAVPFVVLTGLYKLCPLFAFDQDTINEHHSPADVLSFESGEFDAVEVTNPAFDYIPPELVRACARSLSLSPPAPRALTLARRVAQVSLLITNDVSQSPSYIYRILSQYYNPEDYEL
jgi:translation initiation factor eIF-2B subunit beta